MLQTQQIEELICMVAALDRAALVGQFHAYRASFPIDFSREFLEVQPLERLQHIFIALCLHCQHLPDAAPAASAA